MIEGEVVEGYIDSYNPVRGVAVVTTSKGNVLLHIASYLGYVERTMRDGRKVIGNLMEIDGVLWFRAARPLESDRA